jgi:hypothetical protein
VNVPPTRCRQRSKKEIGRATTIDVWNAAGAFGPGGRVIACWPTARRR